MPRVIPQLSLQCDVLTYMSQVSPQPVLPAWKARQAKVVTAPAPHEGVRRALLGSFGSIPAMPEEFTQLLDQLA